MHIVHVGTFPFPSMQGSQVYVRGILNGLSTLGHRVTLLCYGHGNRLNDTNYEVIRARNIPGYRNMRAGPDLVKPLLNLSLVKKLSQLRPDVVHVHNYEAPLVEILARFRRRVPMVYSAHNLMEEELHTYFSDLVAQQIARKVGRFLDRPIPKQADHCVVLREESVPVLRDLGCARVSCVYPGIDPEEFADVSSVGLPSGKWVVYAGNPDAYQNLEVLIRAMQRLSDVGLLLVGASDMNHLAEQVPGRVLCRKTSSFKEVCSYIAAADVAVVPRSVCSGFPIKLLNYLALGVPTVCAEGSAVQLPGILSFQNGNDEQMSQQIRLLLQNPQRCKRLGDRAQKYVLTQCTWAEQAKKMEQVYQLCRQNISQSPSSLL